LSQSFLCDCVKPFFWCALYPVMTGKGR
jgi:hypothetical protein